MFTESDLESVKSRLKATWMAGDFGLVARHIEAFSEEFVAHLNIEPGARLLDVACGTGNVAIPAARAGALVTGVDIATNLLEQARARAKSEGLDIRFEEGDAEQLPYGDALFDIVASQFGVMFAPRQEVAARELKRVCRPGGMIALANWTPQGFVGEMFRTVGRHIPPSGLPAPVKWGEESIVRELLDGGLAKLEMTRRIGVFDYPFPPSEVVEFFRQYFGPIRVVFERLEEDAQAALRRDLEQLWSAYNRAPEPATWVEAEFLEIIAIKE